MNRVPWLRAGAVLFLLGLFTCTWDLLLRLDIGGITLKAHQGLFFLSLLCALIGRRREGFALLAPLRAGFPVSILLLALYYAIGTSWSYFPLKSFLYAGWLVFNLCVVWWNVQLLAPSLTRESLVKTLWAALCFNGIVILVDQIAYQFGYTRGLIGFNQDYILRWGVSRPHAFASEPSFVATFFALGLVFVFPAFLRKPSVKTALAYAFCVLAMVVTTSRTGILTLGIGWILVLSLEAGKRSLPWKRLSQIAVGVLVAAGAIFLTLPTAQKDKINHLLVAGAFNSNEGSGSARLNALRNGVVLARETHWLGVGLGASYRYWELTRPEDKNILPADGSLGHELIMSIWGQLIAEGGLPAVLLYLTAAFFLLLRLFRAWRQGDDPYAAGSLVAAFLFFTVIAFLLGNIARGDVWIWFALWTRMALPPLFLPANSRKFPQTGSP